MGEIPAREFEGIQKQQRKLKTVWRVVIVILLFFSLPLSLLIWKLSLDFRSEAGPTDPPIEVIVSNITDSSVTISFETPNHKTKAIVNYTNAQNQQTGSSFDSRNSNADENLFNLHYHILTNLSPETNYTFSITTGTEKYDEASYKFTTAKTPENAPAPLPIFGKVDGSKFPEGIIYVHIEDGLEDSAPVSSLLPESGAYTLDLGNAKFPDNRNTTGKQIYVFANVGPLGKGATTSSDFNNPIPTITLSQTTENYQNSYLQTPTGTQPIITNNPVIPVNTSIPVDPGIDLPTPTPSPTPIIEENVNYSMQQLSTSQVNIGDSNDPYRPVGLFLSNIAERSFTVNWRTVLPTTGSVAYGVDSDPKFLVLDKRDNQSSGQSARYTHSVDLFISEASENSIVNLKIVSNEIEYPNNGYVQVTLPALLNSPPSPTSQDGEIISDIISPTTTDDYLVVGSLNNDSTWTSTVTKGTSLNWNLSLGNVREESLGKLYSVDETSILNITAYGPNNSKGTTVSAFSEDIKEIQMTEGLSISNIQNNEPIPPQGSIRGTARPSSLVTIEIDGTTNTTNADTGGKWVYILPAEIGAGEKQLTITQDGTLISLMVDIKTLDDLPVTSLEDFYKYMPAIILILGGIYLYNIAQRKEY
jgi:hypothetical protein